MPPVVLVAYIIVRYWRCQEVWGNWRKLLHFFWIAASRAMFTLEVELLCLYSGRVTIDKVRQCH